MRRFASPSLVLALSIAAWGCESRITLGDTCESSIECATGLACTFGRCRAECTTDADCRGQVCLAGVCAQPDESCSESDPCTAVDEACFDSICADRCSASGTCAVDHVCTSVPDGLACVPSSLAPTSDAGGDVVDAGAPDDAGSMGPIGSLRTVCMGDETACATRDGQVYCWGYNGGDMIGDAEGTSSPFDHADVCGSGSARDCVTRPTRAVRRRQGSGSTPLTGVTDLACGSTFACAVASDAVWCWGAVDNGHQLGTGSNVGYVAQQAVAGDAVDVELGRNHACARLADERVVCWGENHVVRLVDGGTIDTIDGRLGFVDVAASSTATEASRFASAAILAPGGVVTCTSDGAESTRCVGYNESDLTGLGARAADPAGHVVPGLHGPVTDLAASFLHACAIDDGVVKCWGGNASYVLAHDTPTCSFESAAFQCRADAQAIDLEVDLAGSVFTALSHGMTDTQCAIRSDQRVVCWGQNDFGQAGDPSGDYAIRLPSRFIETAPGVPLEGATEVACGMYGCCARTSEGVACWGANGYGQLGIGQSDAELDAGSTVHAYAVAVDFTHLE